MGEPLKRAATYADLVSVPDTLVAEIVAGELITSPRPALRHASAGSGLMGWLDGPFRRGRGGPGGWIILFEPELHLRSDVLVPDVAGWRRERMPMLPDLPSVELPPDWVCEILSPRTAAFDRSSKMPIYAREGVGHIWLVDPMPRTLETYRLRDRSWTLLATFTGDAMVRAEPFDAVEFPLADLWAD